MNRLLIFFSIIFVNVGCNNSLNKKDYIVWIRDYENGLHRKVTSHNMIFDVQYKPIDYIISLENLSQFKDFSLNSRRKDLGGMIYFTLKISNNKAKDIFKDNLHSDQEYYERLYYYSFQFKNDLSLNIKGKKIPCTAFHFEKSYNMTPDKTFLLGFEKDEIINSGDIKLIINDIVFSQKVIEISYSETELRSIPKLNII